MQELPDSYYLCMKTHLMWLKEQSTHGQVAALNMDRTHIIMKKGAGEVWYQEKKTNSEEERVKEKVYTGLQSRNKAMKRIWLH